MDQFTLVKISKDGEVISRSDNLSLDTDKTLMPYQIVEANNKIYVADENNGILTFDIFGTYLKTLHLKNSSAISVYKDQVFCLNRDSITQYNSKDFVLTKKWVGIRNIRSIDAGAKRLYFCNRNNIFSYQHSK